MSSIVLNTVYAAKDAISNDLFLPEPAVDGRINTLNNHGGMKFNFFSKTSLKFIEIATQSGKKVLDVGAAFGEVALEALRKGATDYTAIDIEERHLKILARRVYEEMPEKIPCLKLIHGGVPDNNLFEENTFDAILADSVLHFLDTEQNFQAIRQFFTWLKPGGKIFASMGTMYVSVYRSEARDRLVRQIDEFMANPQNDPKTIPGFNKIENNLESIIDYSSIQEKDIPHNKPTKFFSFHEKTAKYFFEKCGFHVEEVFYMTVDEHVYKLDGREYVAVVGKKLNGST